MLISSPLPAQQQESYNISGMVTTTTGRGIDGVTIFFYDGETTLYETTSGGGLYSFTVYAEWTGTITPDSFCYTFTPSSVNIGPVTTDLSQNFTGTKKTFTISGLISDGAPQYSGETLLNPLGGVIITLSNGGGTITDSTGAYSVAVDCGWEGTMTAYKVGYNFTPPSYTYNFIESDMSGQNFVGTVSSTTYTVSGQVSDEFGRTGMDGVTIEFFDGTTIQSEVTSGGGYYSHSFPAYWTGMVTPSLTGFSFTPTFATVGPLQANVTQNFTALENTYNITGLILDEDLNPISGVTVKLSTGASQLTGNSGAYSFPLKHGWSGTVTPSRGGWVFEPTKRTYNNLGSDQQNQNFIGYQGSNRVTISGAVKQSDGVGIPGVTLEFTPGGATATTDDNGEYSKLVFFDWSGTVTPTLSGYTFSPTNRTYSKIKTDQVDQDYIDYTAGLNPGIYLNPTQLNFAIDSSGNASGTQTFMICNSGGGTLNWTLATDQTWIKYTPSSGVDCQTVAVSVDASGLTAGTYNGTITVTDSNAANSPQTVKVVLKVTGDSEPPFGVFTTPLDNSTIRSSVPFTGWALDDIEVESVKIYRVDKGKLFYIGDAVFVEGARPDVELYYTDYPNNSRAGWGYMMLTYFLPNGGNGTYTFIAIARDVEGNETILDTKTITCDNANAVNPFGAIDVPTSGGTASGNSFRNSGWILTPLPNKIPEDGSTIKVYVDGVKLGNPTYNIYRQDIADYFPNYANSNGAMAFFNLDTTAYSNGVHTIYWAATDNAGNSDGIGSRFFSIINSIDNSADKSSSTEISGGNLTKGLNKKQAENSKVDRSIPVGIKKGFNPLKTLENIYPDKNGLININIKESQPIELHLGSISAGYLVVGNNYRPLPLGSTLDIDSGVFYWVPPSGYYGQYRLLFMMNNPVGSTKLKNILINIE